MSAFLFVFFLLYGGVHLYAFITARHALAFGAVSAAVAVIFMLLMVTAPVLVRLAERRGMEEIARFLAYIGYMWMGLLFLYFSASIAIQLYNAVLFVVAKSSHTELSSITLSSRTSFFAACAWAFAASTYGVWEANNIRTEHLVITTPKVRSNPGRIRIVQVSDVHMGLIVRERRIARILQVIRNACPDIVVSTGDLVDGQLDGLSQLARLWQDVNPQYGKFAVTGNHEFYAGLRPSLSITEEAGFQLLPGKSITLADDIVLAGVDDPAVIAQTGTDGGKEHALLSTLRRDRFIVLLKHRPKVEHGSLGLFDLQLSGHVHKGQIFPFNLVTFLFYPVKTGFSRLSSGSSLYVSRGTGTWGPPIRFLAPPEVTIIDIVHGSVERGASSVLTAP